MTKREPVTDHQPADPQESALKFPCAFPIKIMGRTQDGFAQAVALVVRKLSLIHISEPTRPY